MARVSMLRASSGQLGPGREADVVADAGGAGPVAVVGSGPGPDTAPGRCAPTGWRGVRANTPTWQLSILPVVPVYCRPTPADRVRFLMDPVSSTISTPPGPSRSTA
jgi:hypothetical protein